MKKLIFVVGMLLTRVSFGQVYTIPIVWQGDSLGGTWNPHAALLLPVKLASSSLTFYMQLDLGSPYSLFYRDQLEKAEALSSMSAAVHTGDTIPEITLRIGTMTRIMSKVPVRSFLQPVKGRPQAGKGRPQAVKGGADRQRFLIIGTLGADIIDQHVAAFDYPHFQLTIADSLPASFPVPKSRCYFAGGRLFFPVTIRQRQTLLYFDTGSSAFQLLIDSANWSQMADPASQSVSYPVSSWGKTLIAHTTSTSDSIGISSTIIPIHRVTYIEGADTSQINTMKKMGIGGMAGNALFLDYLLILDTRRQLFSITRN
jgi:hypothetical protein